MTSKSRRMPAMGTPMATPRQKKATVSKQALLDNFDLEVTLRTREMQHRLDSALTSFLAMVEVDIVKIPSALRTMTMGDLEACWAGSFAATTAALASKRFQHAHPNKDHAEVVAAAVEGKRKRDAQSPSANTPRRLTKTARTKANDLPAGKKRTVKRTKVVLPASTSTSDHVFNPHLPETPRHPRAPRRNESFFSQNGSPVNIALGNSTTTPDDDELPNPEEMERAAQAGGAPAAAKPAPHRTLKRAPSLHFRTSLAPGATPAAAGSAKPHMAEIPLSDGRTISFDPLALTPGRIDDELAQGGLGQDEKQRVKTCVQEEVVRALTNRMERWKAV